MGERTFLDYVKDGKNGLNEGLPNCFQKFNNILNNTQRGTYYAIGGLPGSGKSTFTDENFVLSPYLTLSKGAGFNLLDDVDWLYYSFEMSKFAKRAKWTAYVLHKLHGLNVDSSYILSRGKNRISDEVYEKVVEVNEFMDKLFDKIIFVQEPMNPTGINKQVFSFAEKHGALQYEEYTGPDGKPAKKITGYVAKNPLKYTLIIIDHVALAKREGGFDVKQNIDKLSEYAIGWRNLFNFTPIPICQFNKGIANIERRKHDKSELAPTLEDFKDTGNIGQDCNIALGVFNPIKYYIEEYIDYEIKNMPDTFRSIHVMKNRDGQEYFTQGMHFRGDVGTLTELPDAKLFQVGLKDYKDFLLPPKPPTQP